MKYLKYLCAFTLLSFIVACSSDKQEVFEISEDLTQEAAVDTRMETCETLGITDCCQSGSVLRIYASRLRAEQARPNVEPNNRLWDSWRILSCAIAACNGVGVNCSGYPSDCSQINGSTGSQGSANAGNNQFVNSVNGSPFGAAAIDLNEKYCTLNCYMRNYATTSQGMDDVVCAFEALIQGFSTSIGGGDSLLDRIKDKCENLDDPNNVDAIPGSIFGDPYNIQPPSTPCP